jgi:hypothetical protein
MNSRELATEFTDLWHTLDTSQINTMLARNVAVDLLEFFDAYADEFAERCLPDDYASDPTLRRLLPNLMIIGYIIRLLEERVD